MSLPSSLTLLLQRQQQQKPLAYEPMWSLKDASRLLGISALALRRATKKGLISCVRLHSRGRLKYRESELRKFLEPKNNDEK